jgi:hypothetical protein
MAKDQTIMKTGAFTKTFLALLVSSILIIANGAWIASNGAPIVVSSFSAESIDSVWNAETFWSRVVFGFPGVVENSWIYFWLFLSALLLICTFRIYFRPALQKRLGTWIVILSILSIPMGGGFYIGAMIGVIAGLYGTEFPKPFKDTFIGKFINSLRFKSELFEGMVDNPRSVHTAALTVIIVALLSGFGSSLYANNLDKIYPTASSAPDMQAASNILLRGILYTDISVYASSIASITIGIIKWLILSVLIFILGVKLANRNVSFVHAFSFSAYVYVPETLLILMPLMFPNEPYLSLSYQYFLIPVSWPLILIYISRLWAFVILVFALEKILDISMGKAIGVALFVSIPYLLLNYLVIAPVIQVPGIRISFTSDSSLMILPLSAIALLIAVLLGALERE